MPARFLIPIAALLVGGCRTIDPPPDRTLLDEGILALCRGNIVQGLESCHAALPLATAHRDLEAEIHTWLAHGYALDGQPEAVLHHCAEAIARRPEDPWIHYCAGVAWKTIGELDQAVSAFTAAIERDPAHLRAHQHRAEAHQQRGEHEAAIADATRALELIRNADDPALQAANTTRRFAERESLHLRARSRAALGDHEGAERDRAAAE